MRIIFCLMVFLFIGKNTMLAQQLSSFVEYGAALHTGDNTPLWQVSNQQGLTSLDNNTYIRGGISYKHQLGKWKFEEALDLVAAAGFSTTGGNQEDSEVIVLRQAGKLRLENIQWDELEQGEQQGRVHHLGTGKREAEYGKLIPQGTSYQ